MMRIIKIVLTVAVVVQVVAAAGEQLRATVLKKLKPNKNNPVCWQIQQGWWKDRVAQDKSEEFKTAESICAKFNTNLAACVDPSKRTTNSEDEMEAECVVVGSGDLKKCGANICAYLHNKLCTLQDTGGSCMYFTKEMAQKATKYYKEQDVRDANGQLKHISEGCHRNPCDTPFFENKLRGRCAQKLDPFELKGVYECLYCDGDKIGCQQNVYTTQAQCLPLPTTFNKKYVWQLKAQPSCQCHEKKSPFCLKAVKANPSAYVNLLGETYGAEAEQKILGSSSKVKTYDYKALAQQACQRHADMAKHFIMGIVKRSPDVSEWPQGAQFGFNFDQADPSGKQFHKTSPELQNLVTTLCVNGEAATPQFSLPAFMRLLVTNYKYQIDIVDYAEAYHHNLHDDMLPKLTGGAIGAGGGGGGGWQVLCGGADSPIFDSGGGGGGGYTPSETPKQPVQGGMGGGITFTPMFFKKESNIVHGLGCNFEAYRCVHDKDVSKQAKVDLIGDKIVREIKECYDKGYEVTIGGGLGGGGGISFDTGDKHLGGGWGCGWHFTWNGTLFPNVTPDDLSTGPCSEQSFSTAISAAYTAASKRICPTNDYIKCTCQPVQKELLAKFGHKKCGNKFTFLRTMCQTY